MDTQGHHRVKGLIIWVDNPFSLPDYHTQPDHMSIQKPSFPAANLSRLSWDLSKLPVLPILSVDPTNRLEIALHDADVWLYPQPILDTSHHNVLKLAGDMENHEAVWSTWDEVQLSAQDPTKRFMLDVSSYIAAEGVVFILVPNPGEYFDRVWQHFLSSIVYDARSVYAIGPGDFDWPMPIQWLGNTITVAQAQIEEILDAQNLETMESPVDLNMFIEPEEAMFDDFESIEPYGDDNGHEVFHMDHNELEETKPVEDEESTLRLDTAVPEKVYLGEIFDCAVAVRQVISPILKEQDLSRTQSGDIQVSWPAGQDTIHLRIEVSAPTCELFGESQAQFRLRYGEDSPVFYFQLSPKRLGSLSIIVKVYQEDFWLGSARVRTQVSDVIAGIVETTVSSHNLALTHTDLEIRIQGFSQDLAGYPVEAHLSNGSHFDNGVLGIDEQLLPTISNSMDYGDYLWECLFTGPIYDAFIAASASAAAATGNRMRLRLWIDTDAPSLHAIIWERLLNRIHTPPRPMSISAKHPFSRYIGITQGVPDPINQLPVRMLFIVSNPEDLDGYGLASLDITAELENLLDTLNDQTTLHITVLAGENALNHDLQTRLTAAGHSIKYAVVSLENILRTLSAEEPYHIVHILAHGRYVQSRRSSELFLQDNDGYTKIDDDNDIILRLSSISPLPHLVFLAACESARRHPSDKNAYVGLASKLVASGIPAVVAMQDRLPIDAAQKLTGDFYSYLMQHGVVDRALAQARLLLFNPSSPTWSTPVLYMRLKDGQLFNLA